MNDWIKLKMQRQPREKEVIFPESLRHAVEKKTKANENRPAKEPRELPHPRTWNPGGGPGDQR